jgi:ubiquinone/menaquinone biosynthesis C-methylase UbiE
MEAEPGDRRPGNYGVQARTYDLTRGASPTVTRAIAGRLGPGDGRALLDVAGGTGNYARVLAARGFRVVVADASFEMAAQAHAKLGPGHAVVAGAAQLPIRDRSFDCMMIVHGVHLMRHPEEVFREARRVIRGGPLVVVDPVRENAPLFIHEYFGLDPSPDARPSAEDIDSQLEGAGFEKVTRERFVYTDTVDGSLHALHTSALHLAGSAYLRNTSFWSGLDDDARRRGLEGLARDLRSGTLEERVKEHFRLAVERGHETVFAAWP